MNKPSNHDNDLTMSADEFEEKIERRLKLLISNAEHSVKEHAEQKTFKILGSIALILSLLGYASYSSIVQNVEKSIEKNINNRITSGSEEDYLQKYFFKKIVEMEIYITLSRDRVGNYSLENTKLPEEIIVKSFLTYLEDKNIETESIKHISMTIQRISSRTSKHVHDQIIGEVLSDKKFTHITGNPERLNNFLFQLDSEIIRNHFILNEKKYTINNQAWEYALNSFKHYSSGSKETEILKKLLKSTLDTVSIKSLSILIDLFKENELPNDFFPNTNQKTNISDLKKALMLTTEITRNFKYMAGSYDDGELRLVNEDALEKIYLYIVSNFTKKESARIEYGGLLSFKINDQEFFLEYETRIRLLLISRYFLGKYKNVESKESQKILKFICSIGHYSTRNSPETCNEIITAYNIEDTVYGEHNDSCRKNNYKEKHHIIAEINSRFIICSNDGREVISIKPTMDEGEYLSTH